MVTVVALAAAAFALLEWHRPAPRRVARSFLAGIAALALGLLALPPAETATLRRTASVVLATAAPDARGPDRATLSLARRLADSIGAPVVRRDTIADLRALRSSLGRVDTLHVVGAGLEAADRSAAAGLAVIVHVPASTPPAVTSFAWTRDVALGTDVIAQGRLAGVPHGTLVRLASGDALLDTTRTDSAGAFRLAARPGALGAVRYTLAADAVPAETLGVTIHPPRLPRLLVLEQAPAFDTRHLKTWLAGRGGEVAVRSLVSRDRYRFEFLNRAERSLARLDAAALAEFDVVVTDAGTLAALPVRERMALRRAVADSGLGLLLRPDDVLAAGAGRLPDADFFLAGTVTPLVGAADARVDLGAGGSAARVVPAAAARLDDAFATLPVLTDQRGRRLAQVAVRGAGRVGVALVTEPGRWVLAGDHAAFADYWSRLLEAVARPDEAPHWEVATPGPVVPHEPAVLWVWRPDTIAAVATVRSRDGGTDTLALVSDPYEPGRSVGYWWPREAGWHVLEAGSARTEVHVTSAGQWTGVRAAERVAATQRLLLGRQDEPRLPAPASSSAGAVGATAALRLPLFLLFVGAAGALWALGALAPPRRAL